MIDGHCNTRGLSALCGISGRLDRPTAQEWRRLALRLTRKTDGFPMLRLFQKSWPFVVGFLVGTAVYTALAKPPMPQEVTDANLRAQRLLAIDNGARAE